MQFVLHHFLEDFSYLVGDFYRLEVSFKMTMDSPRADGDLRRLIGTDAYRDNLKATALGDAENLIIIMGAIYSGDVPPKDKHLWLEYLSAAEEFSIVASDPEITVKRMLPAINRFRTSMVRILDAYLGE